MNRRSFGKESVIFGKSRDNQKGLLRKALRELKYEEENQRAFDRWNLKKTRRIWRF